MEVRTPIEVLQESLRKYDKIPTKPPGWRYSIRPDPKGHLDFFIISPDLDEAWQIKFDSPYGPSPGIGTELEGDILEDILDSLSISEDKEDFSGFRKVPDKYVPRLDRASRELRMYGCLSGRSIEAIRNMLRRVQPISRREALRARGTKTFGPVSISRKPLHYVSDRQREFDEKLYTELRRLMARDYPLYG